MWCHCHHSEPVLEELVRMVRDWVSADFAVQAWLTLVPLGFVTSPGHSPQL